MPAKIYRLVLQSGLIVSLLIVFLVFKDLLFPYITSKQLTFNVLMEFLGVVWLNFILVYPEYRPKKNLVTFGLIAYFLAILMSCAVSVNFTLSFWGNAERMLGLFHLLHFLIFYLILITVFRSWREWRTLLFSSVGVATVVSLIGLYSAETYATIGNTAYVSGYLIFNLFFLLILFFRSENKAARWFYAIPVLIMLIEFWRCHTSGAIIGLFISILFFFFLLGLFHKHRIWRRTALILAGSLIIIVIAIFSQHQAAWFQNSFLRSLTFQKNTFQTRLISWKSAAADFKSHPIFGTGFGNYAITFDKYFDPKFLNYSRSETYFDRAHNNLIDITSTTGVVGLVTYLSIFIVVLGYLWKKFKNGGAYIGTGEEIALRNLEILIVVSLLVAYFIQNLAVFDSYVTYIGLMIILGFTVWLVQDKAGEDNKEEGELVPSTFRLAKDWEWWSLIILLIIFYIFTSYVNFRPWRMFQGVISGYGSIVNQQLATGVLTYQEALVDTPLDHDGRVTLINLVASNPGMLDQFSQDQAQLVLEYAISLAQKNLDTNPNDSLMQMQLAQILDTAARYNYQNLTKFNEYSRQALIAIDRSIEASPGRPPVYLIKAQMLLLRGEKEEAIKTVDQAINLNPVFPDGYCRLAQFYLFLKEEKKIIEPLNKCLDLDGISSLNSGSLLTQFMGYYTGSNDYARALKIAKQLASVYSSEPQILFDLAKLYLISGDVKAAQEAADRFIVLDKTLEKEWLNFVKTVEGTKTPTSSVLK
ncbi:MAG: O-antigen ligase family protein [Patescibacteria group bacterium]